MGAKWREAPTSAIIGTEIAHGSKYAPVSDGVSRLKERDVVVERERSWWIGVGEDGRPLFVQPAPGADQQEQLAAAGGSDWRAVTPLEFYRALVAYLETAPEREEAYLEAMEETLEQWERASSNSPP